jgi:hypothetical protein
MPAARTAKAIFETDCAHNAAARANGIVPQLMAGLKAAGSTIDRKVLADIAVRDAAAFTAFVDTARGAPGKSWQPPRGDAPEGVILSREDGEGSLR